MKQTLLLLLLSFYTLIGMSQLVRTIDFVRPDGKHLIKFQIVLQVKDGMGNPDSIVVDIENKVIDSLHIADTTILSWLKDASYFAKNSLKEKTSYQINHGENSSIFIVPAVKKKSAYILFALNYIGQNDFGAKKSLSYYIYYDLKGNYLSQIHG